ncbi:MAG: OmpA family protein, partial [bacterium]|nr:OmpA family protein [bacterium]
DVVDHPAAEGLGPHPLLEHAEDGAPLLVGQPDVTQHVLGRRHRPADGLGGRAGILGQDPLGALDRGDRGTELREDSKRLLKKLVRTMEEAPEYKIIIQGHTDNIPVKSPMFPSNWELSSARAGSVVRFLLQNGKLNPRRFSAVGHADTQPLVENSSPENQSKNRRVSIIFEVFY